jgi:adenosylhomocysteinase
MPVLSMVSERLRVEQPLAGIRVGACLHVTAETANLALTLRAGGAEVSLCAANPLATQDEVAAALVVEHGVEVRARHRESFAAYEAHIEQVVASARAGGGPWVTIDDGADLMLTAHREGEQACAALIGGTEETTTGLTRLRRLEAAEGLYCPVLAINEARTERALNDRHGTGQSALDGIIRSTNVLLAGNTLVVLGYGWAGQGVAERARGAGAGVIVCEVDPLRALEARMAGYEVMPGLEAARRGDVFVTVTGAPGVLRAEHFDVMKDGAILANAGFLDIEIDLDALRVAAADEPRRVRPLVEQYTLADGRRLNLLADGRVVNLAAAEGHPASVMDVSFALQALSIEALATGRVPLTDDASQDVPAGPRSFPPGVQSVPREIDREVARLKLAALGVSIDHPTFEQDQYSRSFR